ncbi:MAG: hypothetical protein V3W34_12030 [Phycisphaerae bacterium]
MTVVAAARMVLWPVEGQRGAVEDGGQAGASGASAYRAPDDGDADAIIVVDKRGGEDVEHMNRSSIKMFKVVRL